MTTPTTAEVSHRSKAPTVVEIDGFRGRLISADTPTNIAPCVERCHRPEYRLDEGFRRLGGFGRLYVTSRFAALSNN